MPSNIPDGSLLPWSDVLDEADWQVLLLGNGLSINVWSHFDYQRLFDYARNEGLTTRDIALFGDTTNFEHVLADLGTAIRVSEITRVDPAPFYKRYRRIQSALGRAIRQVHLTRSDVPDETLISIRDELKKYEWVFTTSYDLIIYWAMGCGPNASFSPFVDLFRGTTRLRFNPENADVPVGKVAVYFLHGALHLLRTGEGRTEKLRRNLFTLLEQFGEPIETDLQARPLLVTEGSSRDKLRSIESNDYLSHALDRLREVEGPVVVFGSRLSSEDQHLVEALTGIPDRPVAVSLRPGARREVLAKQMDIYNRLPVETLLFFDATTHPLGVSALRVA
jgi:hypothetical protein